jgi:hypothetical protein
VMAQSTRKGVRYREDYDQLIEDRHRLTPPQLARKYGHDFARWLAIADAQANRRAQEPRAPVQ